MSFYEFSIIRIVGFVQRRLWDDTNPRYVLGIQKLARIGNSRNAGNGNGELVEEKLVMERRLIIIYVRQQCKIGNVARMGNSHNAGNGKGELVEEKLVMERRLNNLRTSTM